MPRVYEKVLRVGEDGVSNKNGEVSLRLSDVALVSAYGRIFESRGQKRP